MIPARAGHVDSAACPVMPLDTQEQQMKEVIAFYAGSKKRGA